jgi:hypothetical protein
MALAEKATTGAPPGVHFLQSIAFAEKPMPKKAFKLLSTGKGDSQGQFLTSQGTKFAPQG